MELIFDLIEIVTDIIFNSSKSKVSSNPVAVVFRIIFAAAFFALGIIFLIGGIRAFMVDTAKFALLMLLCSVLMLFTAFSFVRKILCIRR